MEPAQVRALWFQREAEQDLGAGGAADPCSACGGELRPSGGVCLCYVDGRVRNRFHLQLNPTPAPLECHFALHLGVSPGAL